MKKFLLFSALAAGFLASCSEDELASQMSSVNNNTISFATNRAKATTRSGETIKSLDHFTVHAINADRTTYFGSERYTYDSNAGVFKSQTPHYWPTSGTLDFYAINEPGAVHTISDNIPQYDYNNWAAEKDLVAATALVGEKEIPYPLAFKHLTSQIYVSAEAENKEEKLTYKVTSIKMTTPSTGTYSFDETSGGTGTWEIDNSSVSEYSYNSALPLSFTQNGQIELSSLYWNILPVTSGILHFEVQYQVFQNGKLISDNTGDKAKDCIIEKPNLQAGKKYIYNFVLSRSTDNEITFTTTISDWESETVNSLNPISVLQSMTLSHSTMTLGIGDAEMISVQSVYPESASKVVTWSSADSDIASVNAETGVITGKSIGETTITATSSNGITSSCNVTVVEAINEGIENGVTWVNLGLPSGVRWAKMNLGATKPQEYGLYYAWGATTGYNLNGSGSHSFDYDNYEFPPISGSLTLEYDAAHVALGGNWRMPSNTECKELIDNCYLQWTTNYNGTNVKGRIFYKAKCEEDKGKDSSPTESYSYEDVHIFLPAGGWYWDHSTKHEGTGVNCLLWTSSKIGAAYGTLNSYSSATSCGGGGDAAWGYNIRPVISKNAQ